MKTPVADFVREYAAENRSRFHMPGHKGLGELGCEAFDITEVAGADALYEAEGILARSEENATALFGTGRTVFSAEGSSQCIRAMLYLAMVCRKPGMLPTVVAARNVHKSFVYGAALVGLEPVWLWPEGPSGSLCSCPVEPEQLKRALEALPAPPAAVYVTSPDYLGMEQDIRGLAEVCHTHGTILLVDNAHGAYLHFLTPSTHPMDLGADLCCDSAHKTLPVLTGGAYLHISKTAPEEMAPRAKMAMALFGSTSPSYLIMTSLDLCNRELAGDYPRKLTETAGKLTQVKKTLAAAGWVVPQADPLKLTVCTSCAGMRGEALAEQLRRDGIECEFADRDHIVFMVTPGNREEELDRLVLAMGKAPAQVVPEQPPQLQQLRTVCSPREALFSPQETVPLSDAVGRICGAPSVSCPPAIPIAVSGEEISPEAADLMAYYGIQSVVVLSKS